MLNVTNGPDFSVLRYIEAQIYFACTYTYIALVSDRAMLTAELVSTKKVSLSGLTTQWKIVRDDATAVCDGIEYVKICPRNTSLLKIVAESNPLAPGDLMSSNSSLSRSNGLAHMMRLRNEQQAYSFMESVAPACTLFAPPADKKLKVVHARRDHGELRQNPVHIAIGLTVGDTTRDVNVLRSVHPLDNIFVAYDPIMLAHALCFIRAEGFAEKKEKQAELPAGIHRRGEKFVVRFIKRKLSASGMKRFGYRTCNSMDAANIVRLAPPLSEDDCSHDSAHDAVENDDMV